MGSAGAYITAAAFLVVGLVGKDSKSIETGALATSAMLQSAVLVTLLKALFGRQRPSWANGVDRWSGPVGFTEWFKSGIYGKYDSFPRGTFDHGFQPGHGRRHAVSGERLGAHPGLYNGHGGGPIAG